MICRGKWPTHESTANETTHELGGYWDWSPRRTCKDLTFWTWDVANPRTTSPNSLQFHFIDFFHVRYVRSRNLRLMPTIFSKQFLTSTALAMAMVAFWYFFGSLHRPIPVRCSWSVFACKMHSTTEFAMTVLRKCVTHVGSTRSREPLGEDLSR